MLYDMLGLESVTNGYAMSLCVKFMHYAFSECVKFVHYAFSEYNGADKHGLVTTFSSANGLD